MHPVTTYLSELRATRASGRATLLAPLLGEVRATLGIGTAGATLLGMLPTLCFGAGGFLAPVLARRVGAETVALLAVAVSAAGTLARPFISQNKGASSRCISNRKLPGADSFQICLNIEQQSGHALHTAHRNLQLATGPGRAPAERNRRAGGPRAACCCRRSTG